MFLAEREFSTGYIASLATLINLTEASFNLSYMAFKGLSPITKQQDDANLQY